MARLVTSGFELKTSGANAAPDGGGGGGALPTFDTATVRSGTYSLKCAPVASSSNLQWTAFASAVALGSDCFMRAYVYVPTGGLPTAQTTIMELGNVTAYSYAIRLNTNGTFTLWALIGGTTWTQQGSASVALALDSWNRIDLRANTGTGSVDACEGVLNGSSFASTSGLNVQDGATTQAVVGVGTDGLSTPTATIYFDDVAINDSSGAAQNSWPPDSNIVLLRPTADSAVGTGWTLGNATATGGNAWSRLNTAPPDSAADLTTAADADQIRNATSNANVNYDGTMTTYTAAGLGVSDTVNVVVPIIATGAPLVTSAKAGTVGVVSNPTIANISLGAGGTAGAFWSGVAMGTYATGNKWSFGTTTYAPSVTPTTAPVMRVTQVTASTRIAIVTEMGMYVDYTPAPVIPPTPLVHQSIPFYPRASRPS